MLTVREHEVLRVVGRGLTNSEIAARLGISDVAVASHTARILTKLGLRDRAAAIVYAFDHGIVIPGQWPAPVGKGQAVWAEKPAGQALRMTFREPALPPVASSVVSVSVPAQAPAPVKGPRLRLSVLGQLRAWCDDEPLDLGPVRQQALLAALALRPDVTVSQRELLDGVWGLESPVGNVVPVYVYRLRKCLKLGDSRPDSVISRDRCGYRFVGAGMSLDSTRMEEIVAESDRVQRSGDLAEAVAGYARALDLFQGEPLATLPGPFAELERLRLTERRMALSLRKLSWQLRLGRHAEAVGELWALVPEHPHSEPLAVLLMHAMYRSGRRADALAVYTQTRRRLIDDLGMEPGSVLRRAQQAVLRGDDTLFGDE
ncbi:transcriptional regulator [Solihabitans fulvus]|uniref:Transcriptional regulator n=2 Tax=Solihabitans fulvus TaxID=1892852 RepID=A0A5B2XNJ9_9PSEU|nr:transcriptional regulator [Solihabitans fulvus]